MKDYLREKIYLAALLHDIGKFYQRADEGNSKTSKLLSEKIKNSESTFCPQYNGRYTHKHVLWTAGFLDEYEQQFKNLLDDNREISVLRLASAHHNPSEGSVYERIIQKADWYSSGIDRSNDEYSIKEGVDETIYDAFKKKPMASVFEGLFNEKNEYNSHIPLTELTLEENKCFPKSNAEDKIEITNYSNLWSNFISEFKFIQAEDHRVFAESLYFLLSKYAISIPSSTIHLPDVSLFDHLKTTAAFSVAMYDYIKETGNKDLKFKDENPFLLIAGDISGIQTFIYDIIGKNAAKNLKGRSFYLQLLTESILQYMLKELNLFKSNVVYGSGGSFFVLAPNTDLVKDNLKKIEQEITRKIFKEHETKLFLAITSIEFGEPSIYASSDGNNIGSLWAKVYEQLDTKKQQRYADFMKNEWYETFFSPTGIAGKHERDAITGDEFYPGENKIPVEDGKIKQSTANQITLGKILKSSDFWIISEQQIPYWDKKKMFQPAELGIYHYFLRREELEKYRNELKASADKIEFISLNDNNSQIEGKVDFLDTAIRGHNNIYGFSFYGGNDFPAYKEDCTDDSGAKHFKDEPLSFDAYPGDANLKRLAILRMDVDNLGHVLSNGFETKKRTFSRMSTLSRSLDYYFKGYLNTLWKNYADDTFILYSGGDDLFLVGNWLKIIEFAERIKQDFSKWVCHNEFVTISGGAAIVKSKFPILRSATLAAEAENKAKEYGKTNSNEAIKNAFTIFDYALGWDNEFIPVQQLKNELVKAIEEKTISHAVIRHIINFAFLKEQQEKKGLNPSWRWLMSYQFSRMAKNTQNDLAKKILNQVKTDAFANTWEGAPHNFLYHSLDLMLIAARWAELEHRN